MLLYAAQLSQNSFGFSKSRGGYTNLLNTLLDIYRPRVAGQYVVGAIDSRLLGLINEPGGIFHTIAGAIDYQFGFQVSQTWFYKLLEKAILPLILLTVLILYLMTSIVIVGPGQMGVIERLGRPKTQQIVPGLTFKLPWPFDKLYLYPTDLIQKINVGFVEEQDKTDTNLLWGKEHFKQEYDLLVASAGPSADWIPCRESPSRTTGTKSCTMTFGLS